MIARTLRPLVTLAGLVAAWWLVARTAGIPAFLLPAPPAVAAALWTQRAILSAATLVTLSETLLGLILGSALGAAAALTMTASATARRWLMPLLLLSQAIPVFALAPLLVLWLGFGMASKVAMAMLVIFFPVAAAFADGLRRADPGLLDLARTMDARPAALLWHVRLPAALPALGSGLRIAAALAPIAAIIGEWVGASAGLGYVMLSANARIETDLMFAALIPLAAMTLLLWFAVDRSVRWWVRWA